MEQGVYWADIAFPVLSFCLTIVGPSTVALWVIYRVVSDMRRKGVKDSAPVAPSKPR